MDLREPLVSIVTASYNSGRFIEECIRSILSQDYPFIEHIIQDGASTDKTLEVLKKYSTAQYKNRVKWKSKPDTSPVQAVNRALKRVKGDIILFFGADCVLLPHACSWAVNNMGENPKAAVIYGDEYIVDERGRTIKTFSPEQYNFAKLLCIELVLPADAVFIRRSAFEKVGFQLDKSLKNSADYELWVRLGLRFPLKHVKGFISKFRWHSRSHSRSPRMLSNFVKEKKMVIDRIFESPTASKGIKNLRKRAYTGLYFWAAQMQVDSGDNKDALKYLAKALLVDPQEEKLSKYVTYWKSTVTSTKLDVSLEERNRPLVSIVTPSYNSGKFIENCIKSVLNQDYPYIEHIIQDGSSTDRTKKILKIYQKSQYKHRIKIFIEPDNGQSDGLNKALQKAKGEVILVLNADDELLPYSCSWGVFHLRANPDVAVVYGDVYSIDAKGKIVKELTGPRYNYENLICIEIVPCAQTAFIRRSYFEKVGLRADVTLKTCPDYEMWVRIGSKYPMKYVPGFVCKYRWHTGSEGHRAEMVTKFIEAKGLVLNRLFKNQKTKKIKKLKKRAYAGLYMWAARVNIGSSGSRRLTSKLIISSFLLYPSFIWKYRFFVVNIGIAYLKSYLKTNAEKLFKI